MDVNLAIVQVRMGSQRLPKKALLPLCGKPVLHHILEVLRHCPSIDQTVIATTNLKEDDLIANLAQKEKVALFRGSSLDVLSRFSEILSLYPAHNLLRFTGDDPLIDPYWIEKMIHAHKGYDYTTNQINRTFPRGLDTEIIDSTLFKKMASYVTRDEEKEHVTLYLKENPSLFRINAFQAPLELQDPTLRLCLDTREDYLFLSSIFDSLYQGAPLSLKEVLSFLKTNPSLRKINESVIQTTLQGKTY